MQTFLQHARIHTETINKTFQKLGKQDSFKHILKISTSMYETSCSQFFRTTTRIQLGPYTFDESKFVMTFFTILKITEIFSFTWVLEGKAGKKIPDYSRLVFLEKFLAKFYFIRCRSWAIELRTCCRFTFVENNIRNLLKVPKTTFLGSDGLFYFISICKFDSFWNPFKTITNFSELYFSFWRFIPLVQKKKWILWRWVRLDLIFTVRDIYILPTWTHSQNSLAVAQTCSLNISFHGTSLKWSQRPSQSAQEQS